MCTPNRRFWDNINEGAELRWFRGFGWTGNNGFGGIENGAVASDSFARTDDDIMKMRGNASSHRMVLWQGANGGTFQLGWYGYPQNQEIRNENWDIIQTEYHCPGSWNPEGNCKNDAVFDAMHPSGAKWDGPFYFKNINIDGNIRNFMMLGLNETSYLKNMIFENLNVRGNITLYTGMYIGGKNSTISDFKFINFTVNGEKIKSVNDKALNFHQQGNGIDTSSFTFN